MKDEEIIEVYKTQYDDEAIEVISSWSSEELRIAIEESKERLKSQQEQKNNVNTAVWQKKVSAKGLITIEFIPEIEMPSYLTREKS